MKTLAVIAAAVKALFSVFGSKASTTPGEPTVGAATSFEEVFANIGIVTADIKNAVAFLTPPDMTSDLFNKFKDAFVSAIQAQAVGTLPKIVLLPPGVTVAVVLEQAAEIEKAAVAALQEPLTAVVGEVHSFEAIVATSLTALETESDAAARAALRVIHQAAARILQRPNVPSSPPVPATPGATA